MWPNAQFSPDLVTFTEEMLNGKFHFLCSVNPGERTWNQKQIILQKRKMCYYSTIQQLKLHDVPT